LVFAKKVDLKKLDGLFKGNEPGISIPGSDIHSNDDKVSPMTAVPYEQTTTPTACSEQTNNNNDPLFPVFAYSKSDIVCMKIPMEPKPLPPDVVDDAPPVHQAVAFGLLALATALLVERANVDEGVRRIEANSVDCDPREVNRNVDTRVPTSDRPDPAGEHSHEMMELTKRFNEPLKSLRGALSISEKDEKDLSLFSSVVSALDNLRDIATISSNCDQQPQAEPAPLALDLRIDGAGDGGWEMTVGVAPEGEDFGRGQNDVQDDTRYGAALQDLTNDLAQEREDGWDVDGTPDLAEVEDRLPIPPDDEDNARCIEEGVEVMAFENEGI
jgi:hypothetical protein